MKENVGQGAEPWHDAELPFLDVLEQEVRRRAARSAIRHEQRRHLSFADQRTSRVVQREAHSTIETQRSSSSMTAASVRDSDRPGLPRVSMRIARRSLTLVALMSLIGASAYGASRVFSGGNADQMQPKRGAYALVASGGAGADSWRLRLYMRGGELCRALSGAESETSDCAVPPSAGGVEATSAQSTSLRYVFGVTGGNVMSVRLTVGGRRKTVATRTPSASERHAAGLPLQVRFYLATVLRPAGGSTPTALVQAVGPRGEGLGRPVPSCLETGEPGRC